MYLDARKAKASKPGEHYAIDGCPGLRMEAMLTKKTWGTVTNPSDSWPPCPGRRGNELAAPEDCRE